MRGWMFRKCVTRWSETRRIPCLITLLAVVCIAPKAHGDEVPAASAATAPTTSGESTPEPSTSAPLGTLVVVAAGNDPATLVVDGREVGTLPFSGELPAGTPVVFARSEHGLSATRRVVVAANGRTEIELRVVENPARLRVTSAVPGAIIRVDGVPYATGRFEGEIPAGEHAVSVEQQGFVPSVIRVVLKPDELKTIDNVVLERAAPPPVRHRRSKRGLYTMVAADGLFARLARATLAGSCARRTV